MQIEDIFDDKGRHIFEDSASDLYEAAFFLKPHAGDGDKEQPEDLDVDILAGTPFMACNDIAVRPAKHEITIAGSDVVHYGPPNGPSQYHAVRC